MMKPSDGPDPMLSTTGAETNATKRMIGDRAIVRGATVAAIGLAAVAVSLPLIPLKKVMAFTDPLGSDIGDSGDYGDSVDCLDCDVPEVDNPNNLDFPDAFDTTDPNDTNDSNSDASGNDGASDGGGDGGDFGFE